MDGPLTRGAVVTVAAPGEYGKPRPALLIQSDLFDEHPSITVCLITPDLRDAPLFRLDVHLSAENGLHHLSQVMVDKVVTVSRGRIGSRLGSLEANIMLRVSRALALWIGLA